MSARMRLLPLLCLLAACSSDDGMGPGGGGSSNRLPNASIGTGGVTLPRVFISGEAVTLTATSTDLDGDTLTHSWSLSGSAPGSLSATTGSSVTWTAGASAGTAQITLISNDGKGDSPVPANLSMLTGTLVPPGDIPNGTVWSAAQAPYVVTSDIHLPAGNTLTAEAGVQIFFRGVFVPGGGGGYDRPDFTIAGSFNPTGSGTSLATAVSLRGGRNIAAMQWSGLLFQASAPTQSHLVNCSIEDANTGISVSGTGEVSVYNGRIQNNAAGVVLSDANTAQTGTISKARLRRVVISNNLGTGVQVSSAAVYLRQCNIRDNGSTGVLVSASTDPATADADSCKFDSNGGAVGANLSFTNISTSNLHALTIQVAHSNFGIDPDNAPNNVIWGGCGYPPFDQLFDLTGNFWGVTLNDETALVPILDTMSGYAGCVGDPSSWTLANGDWVFGPHSTGAP